ncbi:MAG: hypothetical protein Q7U78_05280 [Gallionella sp.]|nr:hypothetical protein [Gallionella sp.]
MTEQKQFQLSDPEQCELERQSDTIKREQTEGRYTLVRAAQILHSAKGERAILDAVINVPTPQQVMLPYPGTSERHILDKLAKAVISKKLKSYWPGDEVDQEGNPGYGVVCNVLEVYADDLNHWIEEHLPRVKHRFKIADAPVAKVEAVPVTTINDDAAHEEKLAALFGLVPVEALAKTFPTSQSEEISLQQWKKWAEKANRNGLIDARPERARFNLYKAGLWFVRKGAIGWDNAKLVRVLANNLPARSLDDKHLLTGDID